jgi:hypothetical protein
MPNACPTRFSQPDVTLYNVYYRPLSEGGGMAIGSAHGSKANRRVQLRRPGSVFCYRMQIPIEEAYESPEAAVEGFVRAKVAEAEQHRERARRCEVEAEAARQLLTSV